MMKRLILILATILLIMSNASCSNTQQTITKSDDNSDFYTKEYFLEFDEDYYKIYKQMAEVHISLYKLVGDVENIENFSSVDLYQKLEPFETFYKDALLKLGRKGTEDMQEYSEYFLSWSVQNHEGIKKLRQLIDKGGTASDVLEISEHFEKATTNFILIPVAREKFLKTVDLTEEEVTALIDEMIAFISTYAEENDYELFESIE